MKRNNFIRSNKHFIHFNETIESLNETYEQINNKIISQTLPCAVWLWLAYTLGNDEIVLIQLRKKLYNCHPFLFSQKLMCVLSVSIPPPTHPLPPLPIQKKVPHIWGLHKRNRIPHCQFKVRISICVYNVSISSQQANSQRENRYIFIFGYHQPVRYLNGGTFQSFMRAW